MKVVREAMGHGDLTNEAYSQVWEECLAQVSNMRREGSNC